MEIVYLAPVTFSLIAVIFVVSLIAFNDDAFKNRNMFSVTLVRRGEYYRMVSSGFVHLNIVHLLLNLFVLFQFGLVLEAGTETTAGLGLVDFSIVYIASLLGGNVWSLLHNWRKPHYQAVGASGAISGVVAAYCLFYPFSTLWLMGVLPMPALLLLILFLVGSAYFSTRPNTIIGHDAHFGGAVIGAATTVFLRPEAWSRFTGALSSYFGGS